MLPSLAYRQLCVAFKEAEAALGRESNTLNVSHIALSSMNTTSTPLDTRGNDERSATASTTSGSRKHKVAYTVSTMPEVHLSTEQPSAKRPRASIHDCSNANIGAGVDSITHNSHKDGIRGMHQEYPGPAYGSSLHTTAGDARLESFPPSLQPSSSSHQAAPQYKVASSGPTLQSSQINFDHTEAFSVVRAPYRGNGSGTASNDVGFSMTSPIGNEGSRYAAAANMASRSWAAYSDSQNGSQSQHTSEPTQGSRARGSSDSSALYTTPVTAAGLLFALSRGSRAIKDDDGNNNEKSYGLAKVDDNGITKTSEPESSHVVALENGMHDARPPQQYQLQQQPQHRLQSGQQNSAASMGGAVMAVQPPPWGFMSMTPWGPTFAGFRMATPNSINMTPMPGLSGPIPGSIHSYQPSGMWSGGSDVAVPSLVAMVMPQGPGTSHADAWKRSGQASPAGGMIVTPVSGARSAPLSYGAAYYGYPSNMDAPS